MTTFFFAAAALTLAALVLLLRPWWRTKNGKNAKHHRTTGASAVRPSGNFSAALNTTIHRDRLGELERDHANGLISAVDYAEAREELQHQLLDDTLVAEAGTATVSAGRRWDGWMLAVLLPAAAIGLYVLLGNPDALLSSAERNAQAAATVNGMISRLEQKMAQEPGNTQGWVILARAYKVMGRWDDAERAFTHAAPIVEKNATLLAEFADVLLQKTDSFAGRPHESIAQALRLEPSNGKALLLAGAEAFAGKSYAAAASYWERLLKQLDPASDEARMVASGIARAREMGGEKVLSPSLDGAGKTPPVSKATDAALTASAVSGRVELSPALRAQTTPDETVFIFARAVNGSRMPLAVQRVRVADLPFDFKLDDSQAMSPENKISSAQTLRIEVRVSKSGQAIPASGDLTGSGAAVKPGTKGIHVVINQVVK
ncbi:hypothetical protein PG1C_03310 [Rugosibacter aromaticivorans]|uniref:Uncharacterized protein n=1 Tax=Rugosibacter aromaticivorans TaxID=1565605 RepID=A0A0C5JK57_9PROT|nr:c-type cytochrome biogenesis protein CcmI [Rugosibacter aromaticivorans]AJP47756.1 hypothetical protein PG1C_03310 [Rugosibacter aromaticivorans]